jgi:hypothetical protein
LCLAYSTDQLSAPVAADVMKSTQAMIPAHHDKDIIQTSLN